MTCNAIMDVRRRHLPLRDLLAEPEEARSSAAVRGELWTVVFTKDWTPTGERGFALIASGSDGENGYADTMRDNHPGRDVYAVEMIGSIKEVRIAALGLFDETCPEVLIRTVA